MLKFNPQNKVVVLTGAGISAESGIRTFRDSGGLWESHRIDDVATPKGFDTDPALVWNFYRQRWHQSLTAMPNPAHYALIVLENYLQGNFTLVTQNVDGLHKKAGSKNLIEMHGSLDRCLCTKCRNRFLMQDIDQEKVIPTCELCGAKLRPDIVWFGEIPYFLFEIEKAIKECDYIMIIGTSGTVYPAAGFVMTAKLMGAHTIAINKDKPDNFSFIDEFHQGKSGEILPSLVHEWTG
jgi:NAD-dependent deacetylase